jgi:hypothetical protein
MYLQENQNGMTFKEVTLMFFCVCRRYGEFRRKSGWFLDLLSEYCIIWGIDVNTEKNKIIIFNKEDQGETKMELQWC